MSRQQQLIDNDEHYNRLGRVVTDMTLPMDVATMLLEGILRAKWEVRGDRFATDLEFDAILSDVWAWTDLVGHEFIFACVGHAGYADYDIFPDHRNGIVYVRVWE